MDLGPHPDAARASTPSRSSSSNVASDPQHLQAHAAAGAAASAPPSSPATAHEARPPCRRGRGRHRGLAGTPRRRLPVRPGAGSGSSSVGLHRRTADHGQGVPGRVHRRRAGRPHHGGPVRRRGAGRRGPVPVARHGRRVPAQGVREGGARVRAARRRGLVPGHPGGDRPAGRRDGGRARAVRRRRDERGGGGVDRGAGPEPAAAEAEAGGAGRAAEDRGGAGGRGAQRHRVRDRHQGLPRAGRVGAGGGPRRRRHGRRRQDRRRGHRQGEHRVGLLQGGEADRGQESGGRRARVQPPLHQDPSHQLWSP
ncbi:hypothetical protein VPH35_051885 [Triticum aestivum]